MLSAKLSVSWFLCYVHAVNCVQYKVSLFCLKNQTLDFIIRSFKNTYKAFIV